MTHAAPSISKKRRDGLGQIKEEVSQIAEDITRVGDSLQNLASDSFQGMEEKFSGLYEAGQRKLSGFEKRVEARIKERPLKALLIVAGIGFLLGWMKRK